MVEINKLYVVLDEENTIIKAFEQNTEQPIKNVWFKKGAEFDESTDFENAIIVDGKHFEDVEIGKSKLINGEIVTEGE